MQQEVRKQFAHLGGPLEDLGEVFHCKCHACKYHCRPNHVCYRISAQPCDRWRIDKSKRHCSDDPQGEEVRQAIAQPADRKTK